MIKIEVALLIIIGIFLFELIIFLHELGHFITAKLSGVKVNEFALGMGPKIIKFQKGETLYSLRLFPIGGFCSMEGEDENSDDEKAFNNKPVWKRMIIVVAGAFMNLLFGIVLMMITLAPNKYFASTEIAIFSENASSSKVLQVNDKLQYIDGYKINTSTDLSFALATAKSNKIDISVLRNGEYLEFKDVVFPTIISDDGSKILQLDFKVKAIENNFFTLFEQTFKSTSSTIRMVWSSLSGLITGQFGINEVAGPIGMTSAISQATASGLNNSFWNGLNNLIYIMMIITINLGIVNLLPLPALDGGRLIFLIIELIRRKPIQRKYEAYIHAIGMILLLGFMVLISINDIIRLFS